MIAVVTGIGTALAHDSTVRLLDAVDVEWVIVVGIAGAIDDETPIGTLVLPDLVVNGADGSRHRPTPLRVGLEYGPWDLEGALWTTDELLLDPAVHAELRAQGVVALDMETAAIAKVCEERGVPWSVVRAISDRASDGSVDAEIVGLTRPGRQANFLAIGALSDQAPRCAPPAGSARQRGQAGDAASGRRRNRGGAADYFLTDSRLGLDSIPDKSGILRWCRQRRRITRHSCGWPICE